MKTYLLAAAIALSLGSVPALRAQQTVVTTTQPTTTTTQTTELNSAGTVSSFSPDSIVVKTSSGPMTYNYSKKTTFVDADGKVVTYESIHQGDPTTVYYTTENGQQVVSRVVVNRPAPVTKTETTETTTTTTSKH